SGCFGGQWDVIGNCDRSAIGNCGLEEDEWETALIGRAIAAGQASFVEQSFNRVYRHLACEAGTWNLRGMNAEFRTAELLASQRVRAEGRLTIVQAEGRTRLAELYQEGAAKIRLPRHDGDGIEAVLINTAGGLTGGDRLAWRIGVGENAALTLSTQACEKIYRSAGGAAQVSTAVSVGSGGWLAWLPQETILFNRAALDRTLDIELGHGAEALLVEPVLIGRTAHG